MNSTFLQNLILALDSEIIKTKNMRAVIILLCFAFGLFSTSCKNEGMVNPNEVPQAVKAKFTTDHSEILDVKWELEGENYEAEYFEEGMEMSVTYNKEGQVIQTEEQIAVSTLPASILQYLEESYADAKLVKAEALKSPQGNFYEVELESSENDMELIFDQNGNFVKNEEDDDHGMDDGDDDEDDDDDDGREVEISVSELPEAVKSAIAAKYSNAGLIEADEITYENGEITYDIEIRYEGKVIEVMYSAKGEFLGVEE